MDAKNNENARLAGQHFLQACRELAPKLLAIQILLAIIIFGPVIVGLHFGAGWGLLGTLIRLVLWIILGVKFWPYSRIRFVWVVVLLAFVFFAIFEATHLRH